MSLAVASIAAFTAGLAASAHCLAMCGAILSQLLLSRQHDRELGLKR